MFLKKYVLWILLFGSLIGLSETFIASFSIPYRSVILTTISILLLSIARMKMPQMGTSILIIAVAVLFKINNFGVYTCSTSFFLCGPTAMLMLGIFYEIFASVFIRKNSLSYMNFILTCGFAAILTFSIFGLMNTYILKTWDTARLTEYIFIKSVIVAVVSGVLSVTTLFITKNIKIKNVKLNPYVLNSIIGTVVIALWVFGSLTKF